MYKICTGLLLATIAYTLVNGAESSSNVELTNIKNIPGKGYFTEAQVLLKNNSANPKWFILLSPDKNLNNNILFFDEKNEDENAFYLWCYSYENKSFKMLTNKETNGFSAFLLKPQRKILLSNYTFHYFNENRNIEIFEAKTLLVNGERNIEELASKDDFANSDISLSLPMLNGIGFFDGSIDVKETKLQFKENIKVKSITLVDAKKYYFPIEKIKPPPTEPTAATDEDQNLEGLGGGKKKHPLSQ